VQCGE
jgi:hypothetical protein